MGEWVRRHKIATLGRLFLFVVFALVPMLLPGSSGASRALAEGNRLAKEHRLLSAAGQYEAAAARPGGEPRAHSLLGDVLLKRGEAPEAVESLRLAVAGGAYDRRTLIDLAAAQEEAGDLPSSLATLRQALSLRSDDADSWVQLVERAARSGLRPQEIAQRLAGVARPVASGTLGQRVAYLLGACLLDPRSGPGREALVQAAAGSDSSIAEAARDLSTAAQTPDEARRALAVANVLLGQGLLGPALAFLDEEQGNAATEAERQALIGYIFMKTGRLQDAEEALRRSQLEDPGLQVGQLMMGSLLRAEGQAEQAIPYLDKAGRQKPANPAAYIELANALIDIGDYGTAEQALKIAVQTNPDDGEIRLAVAGFYVSRQYRVDKGLPEATEAVRLLGRTPSTLSTLGWGLHLLGRSQEALSPLTEAVALAPESALLRYRLGSVYEQLGLRSKAREQYSMVRELDGSGELWKRAESALDGP